MYRGVVLLYSPRDNLPSVLAFGYNSIQRPVIVVSISIYCFYSTFQECFPDLPSLPCDTCNHYQKKGHILRDCYSRGHGNPQPPKPPSATGKWSGETAIVAVPNSSAIVKDFGWQFHLLPDRLIASQSGLSMVVAQDLFADCANSLLITCRILQRHSLSGDSVEHQNMQLAMDK